MKYSVPLIHTMFFLLLPTSALRPRILGTSFPWLSPLIRILLTTIPSSFHQTPETQRITWSEAPGVDTRIWG
ncbi:hypothetical protein BDV32DRAFT_119737 [Aspergillus pseudonomiae]|nr:hypothetical protein BDV32DRAFT_119737 [Aspergillus pseudonomiae]